ncbi:MAG: cytochrome b/b6 domain-containing protein [Coriobacteriales bacterium]|jgi:Ni/Fe-hydrogenase 1 B-type cytochrome subunit|nr:cytochrome b/b6 domain-containing protein [Coriobacteriales bacterium]
MAHLAHYREAHPLPYVITHWINLLSMIVLAFTGFVIHFPFLPGIMGLCRGAHLFFACLVLVNMAFRIFSSPFIKSAPNMGTREKRQDMFVFLPQKDNRHQFGAWIKYYLFLKKDHPLSGKYGVPQKLAYLAVIPLTLFIAFTGFCLWVPTSDWLLMQFFTDLVGGVMAVRIIHYWTMWIMIIFVMLHVYLSIANGLAPLKMIFLWKEHGGLVYDPKTKNIIGEDDLGEEHA